MYNWHAKVHKSGTKVAVFNGTKLTKVIESSKETFEPAEAQKFAEDLIVTLQSRTSSQMPTPADQPAVTDTNELHSDVMQAVTTQAVGKDVGTDSGAPAAAPVEEKIVEEVSEVSETPAEENDDEDKFASETAGFKSIISNLKKKLARERNDRIIERKARRGLAIAKQLVADGVLEDSYEAIKTKIAQIVKLEDSEIDRLERKVAGEQEFASIEEAQKELRRQARIARLNRQAAAEAQEDGDVDQAEALDGKADEAEAKVAHIEEVINGMSKIANDDKDEDDIPTAEAEKPAEEKADATAPAEVPVEEPKAAASQVPPVGEQGSTPEGKIEEEKADVAPEAVEAEKPAEEKADAVVQQEDTKKAKLAELARSYRLIAANHRKMAEEAEASGDIATADAEDAAGDAAEEKAEDIENKLAECSTEAKPAEEKSDNVAEEPEATEEKDDTAAEEAPVEEEAKKTEARKNPGQTVTSSEHSPLKREGETVDEFGIDKNASLVEQNDYSGDPEVEVLSKMWRGAQKDD